MSEFKEQMQIKYANELLREQDDAELQWLLAHDAIDRALSWCRAGTFCWKPGSRTARTSKSLENLDIVIGECVPVRQWFTAVLDDDRERFFDDLRQRLTTFEKPVDGDYDFWTNDGRITRLHVRTVLYSRGGGELVGLVAEASEHAEYSNSTKVPAREKNFRPYAMLGAGNLASALRKQGCELTGWQYRFSVFRHSPNGCVGQDFRPSDVMYFVRLMQLLAATIADDGCLPRVERNKLARIATLLNRVVFAEADSGHVD